MRDGLAGGLLREHGRLMESNANLKNIKLVLMNKILPLLLLTSYIVRGQIPDQKDFAHDDNCAYRTRHTEEERRMFYPFNIASTVKLVSFRYHKNDYPISEHGIVKDSLVEQQALNHDQVIALTDILFNVGKIFPDTTGTHIGGVNMCFSPRNAVLFIDGSGKLIGYVLICFHCNRIELSSFELKGWDDCNQKVEMIRQFFVQSGIKFGTNRFVDLYPGEADE